MGLKMNKRQKIFITIGICELWGMLNFILMLTGSDLLQNVDSGLNFIGIVVILSVAFTLRIAHELDLQSWGSDMFTVPASFVIQFLVYLLIGGVLAYFVVREKSSNCPESNK